MKSKLLFQSFLILILAMFIVTSCSEDDTRPEFPLSAVIFNSVADRQVAFTALTHSAVSWSWDFGDGQTSTEQNPVHIYEESGYFVATLTATDKEGNTVTDEVTLAIAVTPYVLLTGGATATEGKTWKLTTSHGAGNDYFANADADFTTASGTPKPLPDGIFGQLSMSEAYNDEFTFYYDGTYSHDTKDGTSFGGLVYQYVLNGAADVTNANGADYGLCIAKYTPDESATFTYTENEDFVVPSVYGPPTYMITYKGVSTLDFSGTEFIGFRDFQRKVIINKISDTSMQLTMFMAASDKYLQPVAFNTHALILSFEVVK
ncbi:MAG: PKD domain-containing protein [Bacteroidales bacterium]